MGPELRCAAPGAGGCAARGSGRSCAAPNPGSNPTAARPPPLPTPPPVSTGGCRGAVSSPLQPPARQLSPCNQPRTRGRRCCGAERAALCGDHFSTQRAPSVRHPSFSLSLYSRGWALSHPVLCGTCRPPFCPPPPPPACTPFRCCASHLVHILHPFQTPPNACRVPPTTPRHTQEKRSVRSPPALAPLGTSTPTCLCLCYLPWLSPPPAPSPCPAPVSPALPPGCLPPACILRHHCCPAPRSVHTLPF